MSHLEDLLGAGRERDSAAGPLRPRPTIASIRSLTIASETPWAFRTSAAIPFFSTIKPRSRVLGAEVVVPQRSRLDLRK